MEDFIDRVVCGEMKLVDIPVLAFLILCALVVIIVEIGCVIWFFGILIFALCDGAAKLLMLIPCVIIFSILTATICFITTKMDI